MMAHMNWALLAEQVIARRVELGHPTRDGFAAASGLSARLLTDLERSKRSNYDRVTLARLERALRWPEGRVRDILATPEKPPDDAAESWLSTREGIARHLFRDDLPLVELIYRSGLSDGDKFRLILKVRAAREAQQRDLLGEVAEAIRDQGGWAPEQPYPPLWLAEDPPEA
jgi:transcriptional regulator with XRE-family HTH domain